MSSDSDRTNHLAHTPTNVESLAPTSSSSASSTMTNGESKRDNQPANQVENGSGSDDDRHVGEGHEQLQSQSSSFDHDMKATHPSQQDGNGVHRLASEKFNSPQDSEGARTPDRLRGVAEGQPPLEADPSCYADCTLNPSPLAVAIDIDSPVVPLPRSSRPLPTDGYNDDEEVDSDEDEEKSILPFVYLPASAVLQPLGWQCIAFVLVLFVSMFFLCMALTVTTWRYPDPTTQLQLPDLFLDILPMWPQLEHATDLILGILVAMCFGTIYVLSLVGKGKYTAQSPALLKSIAKPLSTIHYIPWIRFFVCYIAVSVLRIIVISCTILPATNNKCRVRPDTGNFWWNALVGVVSLGGSNVHCGDLLFSGHTAVIVLALCAVWSYGPIVHVSLRPISVVLTVVAFFTILVSRSHYTDDIVIATYISITLWVLHPHDGVRGAHPLWHLLIQNPIRVARLTVEHTRARNLRRLQRAQRKTRPVGADLI